MSVRSGSTGLLVLKDTAALCSRKGKSPLSFCILGSSGQRKSATRTNQNFIQPMGLTQSISAEECLLESSVIQIVSS